jgi:hypothetical protein
MFVLVFEFRVETNATEMEVERQELVKELSGRCRNILALRTTCSAAYLN